MKIYLITYFSAEISGYVSLMTTGMMRVLQVLTLVPLYLSVLGNPQREI